VIDHNHITQSADGVEGCPACERIDNWHMTRLYAAAQLQAARS
jgi:hypothetical protein